VTAPSFTYSGNVYTAAAAGAIDFALTSTSGNPIAYLERAHIHVYKSTNQGSTWIELTRPSQWDFVSSGTVARLATGIATGDWIKVQRITPINSIYVTFQSSALLTADQLNTNTIFNTYLNQEQQDTSQAAATSSAAAATASAAAAASAQAEAASAIAAATSAESAAAAVTTTANAAASAAQAAISIATAAAVPQSPLQVLEPLEILVNAAFSVGRPGAIPFGVGPVLTPGAAFSGISQSDYYPIHHASGSFC
jgi:hypothetical protein